MIREYKTSNDYIYQQYKDDANLLKRINIHKYNINNYKWFNWVFDKFHIKENIKILELGCGNGLLWLENIHKLPDNIEIILSDISKGMLKKAGSKIINNNFYFKVIDAHSIPFADNSFDIIIANHTLYHVKNINIVLSEISRVLKNSGLFFASAFSKYNMKQLKKWIIKFSLNIDYNPEKLADNFSNENGKSILKKYFKRVKLIKYREELRIPEVKTIIDYYESMSKTSNELTDYSKLINQINKILKARKYIKIKNNNGLFISGNLIPFFL